VTSDAVAAEDVFNCTPPTNVMLPEMGIALATPAIPQTAAAAATIINHFFFILFPSSFYFYFYSLFIAVVSFSYKQRQCQWCLCGNLRVIEIQTVSFTDRISNTVTIALYSPANSTLFQCVKFADTISMSTEPRARASGHYDHNRAAQVGGPSLPRRPSRNTRRRHPFRLSEAPQSRAREQAISSPNSLSQSKFGHPVPGVNRRVKPN
jgi:hypothetical protein